MPPRQSWVWGPRWLPCALRPRPGVLMPLSFPPRSRLCFWQKILLVLVTLPGGVSASCCACSLPGGRGSRLPWVLGSRGQTLGFSGRRCGSGAAGGGEKRGALCPGPQHRPAQQVPGPSLSPPCPSPAPCRGLPGGSGGPGCGSQPPPCSQALKGRREAMSAVGRPLEPEAWARLRTLRITVSVGPAGGRAGSVGEAGPRVAGTPQEQNASPRRR